MSTDAHRSLHTWLAAHSGVVTMTELVNVGFSERAVYRLVAAGELQTLQPGVYLSTHWPLGELQRMTAACMRNPKAVIGWLSAAALWSFRGMPRNRLIHVVVPHGSTPALRGVIVHRTRRLDSTDIVTRDDGIRLTSPPRTLLDIADSIGDIAASSVLEQLIETGKGSMVTHLATLARLSHPRRPGVPTMARVLNSRSAWSKAMQSELERRVLEEIRRQGLPAPEVQFTLVLLGGGRVRFDFAWPLWKVALEVDHPYWHAGEEQSHRDKRRDRLAAAEGWQTCRVTDLDVDHGLAAAVADVARILAVRAAAGPTGR